MKKLLYVFYVPLLIAEWFVDLICKIVNIAHDSLKTLTLALESYIHESTPKEAGTKENR